MRNLSQEIQALKAELERLADGVEFAEMMLNRADKERGERLAQGELDCLYLSMVQFAQQAQQGGEDAVQR